MAIGIFQDNSDNAGRFIDGETNTATKYTILTLPVANGERGVIALRCISADIDGGGIKGTKLVEYERTRNTTTNVWTTTITVNPLLATKRTTGYTNGVDFSAEVSGSTIALTVTGMAAKEMYWMVRIEGEIRALHPANGQQ